MSILAKLTEFEALEDGWDGYSTSKAPTPQALAWARHIVEKYKLEGTHWQAVPVSRGGIQLELHAYGLDVEVCCTADGATDSTWADVFGVEMEVLA